MAGPVAAAGERAHAQGTDGSGRAMATVDFRILTGLDVRVAGRSLPAIAAKQRTVLAILLLHPNEVVQIDLLVEGVWGDRPPASARNLIKTYVWRLRQLLDGHVVPAAPLRIATVADGYALRVLPGELDVERFDEMVRSSRDAMAAGDLTLAAARLTTAMAGWPGEALRDTPLEGRFAAELHALGERRLAVLEERIALDMRLGRYASLIPALQRLIAADPLHETWHAHLVMALYQSGRRMAALNAYSAARDILVTELGLEPGTELRSLQQSILTENLAAGGDAKPATRPAPRPPGRRRPARLAWVALRSAPRGDGADRRSWSGENRSGRARRASAERRVPRRPAVRRHQRAQRRATNVAPGARRLPAGARGARGQAAGQGQRAGRAVPVADRRQADADRARRCQERGSGQDAASGARRVTGDPHQQAHTRRPGRGLAADRRHAAAPRCGHAADPQFGQGGRRSWRSRGAAHGQPLRRAATGPADRRSPARIPPGLDLRRHGRQAGERAGPS